MHWVLIFEAAGAVIGAVLLLTPAVGGLLAWSKIQGMQQTVQTLGVSNGELRDENRDLREKQAAYKVEHAAQRAADKVQFTAQLAAQDAECTAKLAHMQGQIDAFHGDLTDRVVAAVTAKLDERNAA